MAFYESQPSKGHKFPLHIQIQLVLEMASILNAKGIRMLTNCEHVKTFGMQQCKDMSDQTCGQLQGEVMYDSSGHHDGYLPSDQ